MLRLLLVLGVVLTGLVWSIKSPFYPLLLYIWNAHFRPEDWVWGGAVGNLNLSFVFSILLIGRMVVAGVIPRLDRRVAAIGALLLHACLSTIVAETPDWSWQYLVEFAKVLVITFAIVSLVDDIRQLRIVILVICLSLGLEAAKQGWIELLLHPGAPNVNTHPALGDNNGVAQAMMMLVPLLVLLARTSGKWWEGYFHRFMVVGIFMRGITTYSRGGFLAAAAIGVFQFARSAHRFRALVGIVLIASLSVVAMPPEFWNRMATVTASKEKQDDSARGRLHFWQTALRMVEAHPLVGVGINGFQTSYSRYDSSFGEYGVNRAVHSTWFGIIAELGIPGIAIFCFVLVLALNSCRRVRWWAVREPSVRELVPYAAALEVSITAYVVSGTFLNSQYSELFWHVIGVTFAMDRILAHAVESSPAQVIALGNHTGVAALPHVAATKGIQTGPLWHGRRVPKGQ